MELSSRAERNLAVALNIVGAAIVLTGLFRLSSHGIIIAVIGVITFAWGRYLDSPERAARRIARIGDQHRAAA